MQAMACVSADKAASDLPGNVPSALPPKAAHTGAVTQGSHPGSIRQPPTAAPHLDVILLHAARCGHDDVNHAVLRSKAGTAGRVNHEMVPRWPGQRMLPGRPWKIPQQLAHQGGEAFARPLGHTAPAKRIACAPACPPKPRLRVGPSAGGLHPARSIHMEIIRCIRTASAPARGTECAPAHPQIPGCWCSQGRFCSGWLPGTPGLGAARPLLPAARRIAATGSAGVWHRRARGLAGGLCGDQHVAV